MKTSRLLLLSAMTTTLALANPYESKEEELASVIETGKKASMTLLKTLGSNLKKHMKAEGPIAAAQFCMTSAYPLTDKVDADFGKDVSIKRISLKYRNPANKPDTGEAKVLESLQILQDQNVILPQYLVEEINKDTYKYYKPLSVNKGVCLKCHGNIKNDKLASMIKESYPEDRATGYKMNDLRGAIVVTVKK
ncbi:MAG: DUF3365 domain-containing protein [Epsilonproteobacteria bacterium]|nr:MAG: DUF3365 domain-containing protein [Campylobacterota bacterium]